MNLQEDENVVAPSQGCMQGGSKRLNRTSSEGKQIDKNDPFLVWKNSKILAEIEGACLLHDNVRLLLAGYA